MCHSSLCHPIRFCPPAFFRLRQREIQDYSIRRFGRPTRLSDAVHYLVFSTRAAIIRSRYSDGWTCVAPMPEIDRGDEIRRPVSHPPLIAAGSGVMPVLWRLSGRKHGGRQGDVQKLPAVVPESIVSPQRGWSKRLVFQARIVPWTAFGRSIIRSLNPQRQWGGGKGS